MRAKLIGTISQEAREEVRGWCQKQPLRHVTGSSYVQGRREMWMGLGSNLGSIRAGRAALFTAAPVWDRLRVFGDRHLAGWNSILICGGPTSIDFHRDHGHFAAPVLMLNLGEAEFGEQEDPRDPRTQAQMILRDGDVVLLDSKVLHRSRQLSPERFHITWRTIKPEYVDLLREGAPHAV